MLSIKIVEERHKRKKDLEEGRSQKGSVRPWKPSEKCVSENAVKKIGMKNSVTDYHHGDHL